MVDNLTAQNEFLTVGDIIILTHDVEDNEPGKRMMSSDGVISSDIFSVLESSPTGKNLDIRGCLFRIENARKIQQALSDEDDQDFETAKGKQITYGERI